MLGRLRQRLTYANVMATIGVFLGLGGTAWAVAANSVGTAQLQNGAVTKPKLAANSVGPGKVIDKSLTGADIDKSKLGFVPDAVDSLHALSADQLGGKPATGYGAGMLTGRLENISPLGGSTYGYPEGETPGGGLSEAVATELSPASTVVARDLSVQEDWPQGAIERPSDRTYTLRVNGADTALTCTASGSSGTPSCDDTAHAVSIPAGSKIALHVAMSGTGSGTCGDASCQPKVPVRFGWRAAGS